ncbi:hypothetical protein KC660_04530 [Candidatus Dojkabacteria bacterium]|uniref:GP-PDE domain-containing protein n=1 Tax=Candidatus Dojkabacteria bacterium TaxID=2099670 RepID=A0A955L473_9BACT|nr:hypothetical protein [Candidatus Dojkabacteria bacterium]
MKLIAHRCNTLESFDIALAYNPDAIEMDIVYFENSLYLYHPSGNKNLFGHDVDQIIQQEMTEKQNKIELDLKNIAPKLLDKAEFLLLDLKQKSLDVLPQFLEQVKQLNAKPTQILVGSRDTERMEVLKENLNSLQVLSLGSTYEEHKKMVEMGATKVRLWEDDLSKDYVKKIKDLGVEVFVTAGYKTSPERKGNAGFVTIGKLEWFNDLEIDAVLVNDMELARKIIG